MHQHIVAPGTFARMKPYQLIQGLMAKQGISGPMPLAKAAKVPEKQPQIHRWLDGQVTEPKRATVEPLAKFFDLPIEACYDEREATKIARERGIPDPLPIAEKKPRRGRGNGVAFPGGAQRLDGRVSLPPWALCKPQCFERCLDRISGLPD